MRACLKNSTIWVLNYLPTGKWTIPCEMITRYDSLEFVLTRAIFSFLTTSILALIMAREEYDKFKTFYQTLKQNDLGELNKTYKFQDTVILCEIFEHRSSHLHNLYKFNPGKWNSTSYFSGCVHRDKFSA